MIKFSTCLILIFIACWGSFASAYTLKEPTIDTACNQPAAIFHIASSQNSIFTDTLVKKISSCAYMITLNVRLASNNGQHSIQTILKRLRKFSPNLPVLSYFRVTQWRENTIRADGNVLSEIGNQDDWALETRKRKGRKIIFTDFRSSAYVEWLVQKVSDFTIDNGFNGVFIDALQRSPVQLCPSLYEECEKYRDGIDSFLEKLTTTLNEKNENNIILFNGAYSDQRISDTDVEQMLNIADGAMVEHFGLVKKNRRNKNDLLPSFESDIRYYQKLIKSHPTKIFGVFGRENYKVNRSTLQEWPDYLYAAFLMIKRDNVYFKYHSSFQIPSKNDLTNGLFVVPRSRMDLGSPVGSFQQDGCLQIREFEKYFVLLCDFDSDSGASTILQSKTGDLPDCEVTLEPGNVVFLKKKDIHSGIYSCNIRQD